MSIPVDSITSSGRYFFQFTYPSPIVQATRLHSDWASVVSDSVAAQTGAATSVVASGTYDRENPDGSTTPLWGLVLDVTMPNMQGSVVPTTGGAVLVPAQLGVIAISVAVIVSAVAAALVLPHLADDFLNATQIFSSDSGPWNNLGSAAKWGAGAAIIGSLAALVWAARRSRHA